MRCMANLIRQDKAIVLMRKTTGGKEGNGSDIGQLVKVNAATGQETLLKSLPVDGKFHDRILYVPALNEFVGTWEQKVLFRLNSTSLNYVTTPPPAVTSNTYNYFTTN